MLRYLQESKDKYRPRFCNSEFYSENQPIFQMWKTLFKDLSDVEKVQAWVFALSCLRRPQDWFGGLRSNPFDLSETRSSLLVCPILESARIKIPQKIQFDLTLKAALNFCRIKPLPESALRSLYKLTDPNYPIKILNYVPTPFELLNQQTEGYRIITFNEDYETWPTQIHGERDFLSFILHDLVHADHFLNNETYKKGQLGFYKLIQFIWHHNSLQALMLNHQFKKGFEYIISDMNAHPVHLVKTLKALLFESVKNDSLANSIWQDWISNWSLDTQTLDSFVKINKKEFSISDALNIEELCFKKGLGH